MSGEPDVTTSTLAETANLIAWKAIEPDGEATYHLELGTVTLHFFLIRHAFQIFEPNSC
jgi:hypothetical protein